MNWFNQNRGYILCALLGILVGALGVLWIKGSKSQIVIQNPIVDKPIPVQPKFGKQRPFDSIMTASFRVGGSIEIKEENQSSPAHPKITIPEVDQSKPITDTLCPPFTLHLISADSVPRQFGLDSVSVAYRWPPGDHYFAYWGHPPSTFRPSATPGLDFVRYGLATTYLADLENLSVEAYLLFPKLPLCPEIGYRGQSGQHRFHPGLYLRLKKEGVLF